VSFNDNGDIVLDKYAQIGEGVGALFGIGATADNGASGAGMSYDRPLVAQVGVGAVGAGVSRSRDSGNTTTSGGVSAGARFGVEVAAMEESGTETIKIGHMRCN